MPFTCLEQSVHRRLPPERAHAAPLRLAHDDPGHVASARVLEQRRECGRTVERHGLRAERLGEPQHRDASVPLGFPEAQQRRSLDGDHDPLGIERIGKALAEPDEFLALGVRPDADEEPFARKPRPGGRLATLIFAGSRVDAVGRLPQGEFAQRKQVRLAKEPLEGSSDLLGHVDLARLEPFEQVLGREVDQLDLGGVVEDPVRHGLLLPHARDPGDHVVEALDVLDIECRPHVEPGLEHLVDVLPAFGVAWRRIAVDEVRMGQLVDDRDGGAPAQGSVEIELAARHAAITHWQGRQLLEAREQTFGLGPTVRFDVACDDVGAGGVRDPRRLEHRKRLADARGGPEEDPQTAAFRARLGALHVGEQPVWVRSAVLGQATSLRPARGSTRAR